MESWSSGQRVILRWGIKASLLQYMKNDPTFAWEESGDATFDRDSGIVVSGVIDEGGILRLTGDITFRAHDGALTVPIVAGHVDPFGAGHLTIADPVDGLPGRVPFVRLAPVGKREGRWLEFTTALADGIDYLFMFNYLPGAAFDNLSIDCAIQKSPDTGF